MIDPHSETKPRSAVEIWTELLFLMVVCSGFCLTFYGVMKEEYRDFRTLAHNIHVQMGFLFTISSLVALVFFLRSENRRNFLTTALLISALFHLSLVIWSGFYSVGESLAFSETAQVKRVEALAPKTIKSYDWVPASGEVVKHVYDEVILDNEIMPDIQEKRPELMPEVNFEYPEMKPAETEARKEAAEIRFEEQQPDKTLREMENPEKIESPEMLRNAQALPALKPVFQESAPLRPSVEVSRMVNRELESARVDLQEARRDEKALSQREIQAAEREFRSTVDRTVQKLDKEERASVEIASDVRVKAKSEVVKNRSPLIPQPGKEQKVSPGVGETDLVSGRAVSPYTRETSGGELPAGVAPQTLEAARSGQSAGMRDAAIRPGVLKVDRAEGEVRMNAANTGRATREITEVQDVMAGSTGLASARLSDHDVIFLESRGGGVDMLGPESSSETFSSAALRREIGTVGEVGIAEMTPLKPAEMKLGGGLPSSSFSPTAYEPYRQRARENHQELIKKVGGDPEVEKTVERGLVFLAQTQFPDGRWAFDRLPPGSGASRDEAELGQQNADTGATGIALLAFLGSGYTHLRQEGILESHHECVQKGLDWLIRNQQSDGSLFRLDTDIDRKARIYSHGIATISLCEAYGMTRDPRLKGPAQKAVDFIINHQTRDKGAWRYTPEPGQAWRGEGDTSISGWMLMALVSAKMAGLDVPDVTVKRVQTWLNLASVENGAKYVYLPMTNPQDEEQREWTTPTPAMTAEGMLMRLYLRPFTGQKADDAAFTRGLEYLASQAPHIHDQTLRDTYYWYYGTQVMFHAKGKYWEDWQEQITKNLMSTQIQEGALHGSWSPTYPVLDRWGHVGGRHYITTMHLLILEVYYRHLPLYGELVK